VGHITVGDQAVIGAQTGVSKSIPPKTTVFGSPGVPAREFKEGLFYQHKLKKLYERVKKLEQVLDAAPKSSSEES
jgi:UDP-3-O-[3-hydroxymyristoyl] glucosamine N-acyltransferase